MVCRWSESYVEFEILGCLKHTGSYILLFLSSPSVLGIGWVRCLIAEVRTTLQCFSSVTCYASYHSVGEYCGARWDLQHCSSQCFHLKPYLCQNNRYNVQMYKYTSKHCMDDLDTNIVSNKNCKLKGCDLIKVHDFYIDCISNIWAHI